MRRCTHLLIAIVALAAQAPAPAEIQVGYFGTGGAETIRLRLRNCTNQAATHRVYAGEVHACTLPGNQPLVTGQDLSYRLGPNEQRDELVPVYCGNSFLFCPPPGTRFRRPSAPYPRLRQIILDNCSTGDTFRVQELIWQETDDARLPESGPPTVLEMLQRRHMPRAARSSSADGGVPGMMCLASLQARTPSERSRTEAQQANVRAMGWIGLFLIVPLPIALIFMMTWLLIPAHRPSGPHRA